MTTTMTLIDSEVFGMPGYTIFMCYKHAIDGMYRELSSLPCGGCCICETCACLMLRRLREIDYMMTLWNVNNEDETDKLFIIDGCRAALRIIDEQTAKGSNPRFEQRTVDTTIPHIVAKVRCA